MILLIKMDKRKSIILATIVLLAATAFVAVAQQGTFITLIPNFSGLVEEDRKILDSIDLGNLPNYFEASLIIEGSKYTGQLHTVDLNISHTRPGSSVWLADGNYSLTLEYLNGTKIGFPIMYGSFTDLTDAEQFSTPTASWTPTCPNGTYFIALSMTELDWIQGYIIDANASFGGTIEPLGPVTVHKGENQGFTITADEGYEISQIIIDGEPWSILFPSDPFDPYVTPYVFIFVDKDHTIEASFTPKLVTMMAINDSTKKWYFSDATDVFDTATLDASFNGSDQMQYLAGVETVSLSHSTTYNSGQTETLTSVTYSLDYMYLNRTGKVNVVTSKTVQCSIAPGEVFTIVETFTAPSIKDEIYTIELYIESVIPAPP